MVYSNDLHYMEFDPILLEFKKFKIYAIRPIASINFHPMSKEYIIQRSWENNYKQVLIKTIGGLFWTTVCNHQIKNIKKEIRNGYAS